MAWTLSYMSLAGCLIEEVCYRLDGAPHLGRW